MSDHSTAVPEYSWPKYSGPEYNGPANNGPEYNGPEYSGPENSGLEYRNELICSRLDGMVFHEVFQVKV